MKNLYNYYFIGIGGISMSALAKLLFDKGYGVMGSDACKSKETEKLKKLGIKVNYKPNIKDVELSDIVVTSSAISDDNKELKEAERLNKQILTRGELLGQISKTYKHVIAVSGAHGKTTTTALIAHIFMEAGLQPTVHIGGIMQGYESNLIEGKNKFFITEACEYKDNFLNLHPDFSVILNIEPEHLDYFKTFENVKKSFKQFAKQSKNFIAQEGLFDKGLTLGKDYTYSNFLETINGIEFDYYKNNTFVFHVKCPLHGKHNVFNILAAIAVAEKYNIYGQLTQKALASFKGVKRRSESYQFKNNSKLIFDYAHHPTEIKCSINSIKKFCKGDLIVIFQPHTYSRTKKLFSEFLQAFDGADKLIIFKTYPAREKYDRAGSAKILAKALNKNKKCRYSTNYCILKKLNVKQDDCVLVLGAGDFYDKCKF